MLQPEAYLDLQIGLDRLHHVQARCREALKQLMGGSLPMSDYLALLDEQLDAQKAWEQSHRKYFSKKNQI